MPTEYAEFLTALALPDLQILRDGKTKEIAKFGPLRSPDWNRERRAEHSAILDEIRLRGEQLELDGV